MTENTLIRMDNMGVVVESIDNAIDFFKEIGMNLEHGMLIEDEWAGRVTGIRAQKVEIAILVTPDGHGRLELVHFLEPSEPTDHRTAPVNALGYQRLMFAVKDLDELLSRLAKYGAEVVDEVVRYENAYKLCYIRGVEGLLIGLAEPLSEK